MNDLWGLQQAIYSALTGPSTAIYPVYDAVPPRAAYPYIVIGEISGQQDEEITEESTDVSVSVHGWSRKAGKVEAHAILEYVKEQLHGQDIGAGAWAAMEEFRTILEDPKSTADSRLFHAVSRYRIRIN
jgi:hypothetical protein